MEVIIKRGEEFLRLHFKQADLSLSFIIYFFWSRSKSILFFKEKFHSNAADMQTEEQEHASKLR